MDTGRQWARMKANNRYDGATPPSRYPHPQSAGPAYLRAVLYLRFWRLLADVSAACLFAFSLIGHGLRGFLGRFGIAEIAGVDRVQLSIELIAQRDAGWNV